MEDPHVFIELVIKNKWLSKLIARNKLATCSLFRTKLAFKIKPVKGKIPDKISISSFQLSPEEEKGYTLQLYGLDFKNALCVTNLKANKKNETNAIKLIFPYQGIFWIIGELSSEPYSNIDIETKTLEGHVTGYTSRKEFRLPVIVIDILTEVLIFFGLLILILTGVLVFLTLRLI